MVIITVSSFDASEELAERLHHLTCIFKLLTEKPSSVSKKSIILSWVTVSLIPVYEKHHFNAKEQFKMIVTIIKSGYKD